MEKARYCRNCGHALEVDAKFCTECGTAVRRTDPAYSEMKWSQDKQEEAAVPKAGGDHMPGDKEMGRSAAPKRTAAASTAGEAQKKTELEQKKRRRNIIIASAAAVILVLAGAAVFGLNYADASGSKNLKEGQEYLAAGEYEKAITSFEEAVKEDEGSVEARLGLADAYTGLEEYSTAISYLDEALEINDISLDAYGKKADIYSALDQNLELNKLVRQAVSKNVDLSKDYGYSIPEVPSVIVSDDAYSTVSISGKGSGTTIRYTMDGADPTEASSLYEKPLENLSGDVMVKAVAINDKKLWSDVVVETLSLPNRNYSYDKEFTSFLGKTYKELNASVGPLTAAGSQEGGMMFTASGTDYVFSFESEEPADSDRCTSVNTDAGDFFQGIGSSISAADAQKTLGVTLESSDGIVFCEIGDATIYIYIDASQIPAGTEVRCKLTKDVRGQ